MNRGTSTAIAGVTIEIAGMPIRLETPDASFRRMLRPLRAFRTTGRRSPDSISISVCCRSRASCGRTMICRSGCRQAAGCSARQFSGRVGLRRRAGTNPAGSRAVRHSPFSPANYPHPDSSQPRRFPLARRECNSRPAGVPVFRSFGRGQDHHFRLAPADVTAYPTRFPTWAETAAAIVPVARLSPGNLAGLARMYPLPWPLFSFWLKDRRTGSMRWERQKRSDCCSEIFCFLPKTQTWCSDWCFKSAREFVDQVPVHRLTFYPDQRVWQYIGQIAEDTA